MKNIIVLFSVDVFDRNEVTYHGSTFTDKSQLINTIQNTKQDWVLGESVLIFDDLWAFCEQCNDQEIDLEQWWLTHVYLEEPLPEDSQYIVIETFGGPEYVSIVTDEAGNNKVFNTKTEALAEADELQDGRIIEL